MRIIEQDLWERARARQRDVTFDIRRNDQGNALNRAHRREFLLSSLLTCGCCGGRYTIMAKDRYGCAVRRRRGTCDNGRTVDRQRIEQRVLSGLKDKLLSPALVEEFVRAFADETAALRREAAGNRIQLEIELAEVQRRLQGIISAIEKGAYNATVQTRLNELEARQAELVAQLNALETVPPVVQLHPNAAAIYRDKVADLESALNSPEIRTEAGDALRALIERVVLILDEEAPDGLRVELYGDLPEILCLGEDQQAGHGRRDDVAYKAKLPGTGVLRSQLSVVAGAGNHLDLLLVRGDRTINHVEAPVVNLFVHVRLPGSGSSLGLGQCRPAGLAAIQTSIRLDPRDPFSAIRLLQACCLQLSHEHLVAEFPKAVLI